MTSIDPINVGVGGIYTMDYTLKPFAVIFKLLGNTVTSTVTSIDLEYNDIQVGVIKLNYDNANDFYYLLEITQGQHLANVGINQSMPVALFFNDDSINNNLGKIYDVDKFLNNFIKNSLDNYYLVDVDGNGNLLIWDIYGNSVIGNAPNSFFFKNGSNGASLIYATTATVVGTFMLDPTNSANTTNITTTALLNNGVMEFELNIDIKVNYANGTIDTIPYKIIDNYYSNNVKNLMEIIPSPNPPFPSPQSKTYLPMSDIRNWGFIALFTILLTIFFVAIYPYVFVW